MLAPISHLGLPSVFQATGGVIGDHSLCVATGNIDSVSREMISGIDTGLILSPLKNYPKKVSTRFTQLARLTPRTTISLADEFKANLPERLTGMGYGSSEASSFLTQKEAACFVHDFNRIGRYESVFGIRLLSVKDTASKRTQKAYQKEVLMTIKSALLMAGQKGLETVYFAVPVEHTPRSLTEGTGNIMWQAVVETLKGSASGELTEVPKRVIFMSGKVMVWAPVKGRRMVGDVLLSQANLSPQQVFRSS